MFYLEMLLDIPFKFVISMPETVTLGVSTVSCTVLYRFLPPALALVLCDGEHRSNIRGVLSKCCSCTGSHPNNCRG